MNHPINLQYKMGNFSNLDRWIINQLSDGMAPKPCSDAVIQSPRLVQEGTWAPTSRPSSIRLFTDVVGPATLLSSSFFIFCYIWTVDCLQSYEQDSMRWTHQTILKREGGILSNPVSQQEELLSLVFFWCQSFTLGKSQSKMINELGELAGFGRTTARGCSDFFSSSYSG